MTIAHNVGSDAAGGMADSGWASSAVMGTCSSVGVVSTSEGSSLSKMHLTYSSVLS